MSTDTKENPFATPSDCLQIITTMENSLLPRSEDRALIDVQFNGGRPFTAEEEKEFQIQVNANFLEGYKIAQAGILQMNTALLYKERFCNLRCLKGPTIHRTALGEKMTNNFNKVFKQGKSGHKYTFMQQNRNAALVLHGVGPVWWSNSYDGRPKFVSLDDLLIPTDTPLEMSDELGQFAINSWLTAWQLYQMTQSEKRDPGWDTKMGMDILRGMLASKNFIPDYFDQPEKMESMWKQRSTYLNSDAVPKVKITTFYHQDPENGKWYRKVLVRENQAISANFINKDKFLYNSKKTFADSIDQILHIQFGDGSVVAPFKYRSVRGLGILLFSLIELMNRLRCQNAAHVFSNLVPLLRVNNPSDRDRPRMVQFQPYTVVEDGVTFIPKDERHQIDSRLVESQLSEFRQLMSENSSSYVQDVDVGSSQPQTLGEAQIKLQSANRIVASMLMGAYCQEGFLYEEMLRRFLRPVSGDPEVIAFQEACKADGIPTELMEPACWRVEITKAFGAGDQTLAGQEVTALLQIAPQLDPSARRIIQRDYVSTITKNPDYANQLVPEQKEDVTDGRKAAEDVFGTLMQGAAVGVREGIEQTDYVASMLASIDAVIAQIKQLDDVGTHQQVAGLQMAIEDTKQHLAILEQDPNEKQFVAAAGQALGKLENEVKGFAQRQSEAAEKSQIDPAAAAKIKVDQMIAAQKMEIAEAASAQKLEQDRAKFQQQMAQEQAKFSVQMQQMATETATMLAQQKAELEAFRTKTATEMAGLRAKTLAEIAAADAKTDSEIENSEKKTEADVKAKKKMAAAAPAATAN